MTTTLSGLGGVQAPFPGLRAFDADEALLFYGRERHVGDLLERLGDARFVAVTGSSGSGKSSLVRAGLLPALSRGYLSEATSRWRFAVLRPGGAPLDALALALARTFELAAGDDLVRRLRASSAGLSEVVAGAGMVAGESLLVVVDQFEELFRYDVTRAQQAEAALFVSALLEASEQRRSPVFVVITMRSEFLGRCSEFAGLAEACNRSQYLVPRLTRDERQDAIERPLRLFDTIPTPALVQQVLNEAGDDPDLLPVLQHVMLRTYREWLRQGGTGRLEQRHYEAVGSIDRALDIHGDEILNRLDATGARMAERLFRSLTVVQNGVVLRRPRRLKHLYDVVGADTAEARKAVEIVIARFADRNHSFLMLSAWPLAPDTVVDITHESLIRKWRRLDRWVRDEARGAEWYSDLLRDVVRHRAGEGGLWQDPELATALRRRQADGWTAAWADQYREPGDPPFADVMAFLDASAAEQDARQRREAELRDQELRHAQALAQAKRRQSIILGLLLVGVAVIAVVLFSLVRNQQKLAEATLAYQRASEQGQAAAARLADLEAEQAALRRQAASTPAASPQDRARLDQLTQEIETARMQAKGSQDELAKLRKDRELLASDRGGLVNQVESLRQQLTQVTRERDALREASKSRASSPAGTAGSLGTLPEGRSLPETTNPRRQTASVQDVIKAFSDGVRSYERRDWAASATSMQNAIALQPGLDRVPAEVRVSGMWFMPYAPQSYLAAALEEMKADCGRVAAALARARAEKTPSDLRRTLQAARTRCPS